MIYLCRYNVHHAQITSVIKVNFRNITRHIINHKSFGRHIVSFGIITFKAGRNLKISRAVMTFIRTFNYLTDKLVLLFVLYVILYKNTCFDGKLSSLYNCCLK